MAKSLSNLFSWALPCLGQIMFPPKLRLCCSEQLWAPWELMPWEWLLRSLPYTLPQAALTGTCLALLSGCDSCSQSWKQLTSHFCIQWIWSHDLPALLWLFIWEGVVVLCRFVTLQCKPCTNDTNALCLSKELKSTSLAALQGTGPLNYKWKSACKSCRAAFSHCPPWEATLSVGSCLCVPHALHEQCADVGEVGVVVSWLVFQLKRHICDGLKPGHVLAGRPCGWPGQSCGTLGAVAHPLEPQLKSSCHRPGWAMAKHSQWDRGCLSCSSSELALSPEDSPPAPTTVTKLDIPIAILVLLFPDWDSCLLAFR